MNLTPDQLNSLPPDQRENILALVSSYLLYILKIYLMAN